MNKTLFPIFGLWVPLVVLAIQLILEFIIDTQTLSLMHSENGPHEIFNIYIFVCYSELQESYMLYFVLLYLILLYQKAIKLQNT